MRFDREQLETLAAVVDTGTFDAAARRLSVTPSAVSQRIKAFERELGRVLVVRSKPVRATASGEAIVRLARQLATLEHDALGALGIDDSAARTSLPIAVNADSMASWILPALARAGTRLPIVPSTKLSTRPLRFLPWRTTITSISVVPFGWRVKL